MALNDAIVASPADIYTAPYGEAMPAVNVTPAGNWALLGSVADQLTQDDAGVVLTNTQTVNEIRGAGATAAIKAVRSEESVMLEVNLMDMTFEVLTFALRGATVTEVAAGSGTIGTKAIPIWRGTTVQEHAVLVRGPSPYLAATNMQVEVPRAYAAGDLNIQWQKAQQVVVNVKFGAMMDLAQTSPFYLGRVIAQHQVAGA